jgi:hypothetical protein
MKKVLLIAVMAFFATASFADVVVSKCGAVWTTSSTLTDQGRKNAQAAVDAACGTNNTTVTVANP